MQPASHPEQQDAMLRSGGKQRNWFDGRKRAESEIEEVNKHYNYII